MKILVHDHGLCLELALKLGAAGHSVGYYVTPTDKHSLHDVRLMGRGFPGVEKVDSFWSLLDSVELICDFDTHNGDEVDWLRAKGNKVWGATAEAECLELDRWAAKGILRNAGLPMVRSQKVTGVANLIEVLQKMKDVYVKCSGSREVETFFHENWPATQETYIAPLLSSYGTDPDLEFVLEDKIDPAVEIGSDGIHLRTNFSPIKPYGYEDKDSAYIGTFSYVAELPKVLAEVNRAITPSLRGSSCFVSTEVRVTPSRAGYPIDLTIRAPHPPLAAMMEAMEITDTIVHGSQPHVIAKYAAVLCGTSGWAEDHRMEVTFPHKLRQWIKFSKAWQNGTHYYTIPSTNFPVQVVGMGETIDQAIRFCRMHAEQVHGKELSFDFSSLDKLANETIPLGRKYGIQF